MIKKKPMEKSKSSFHSSKNFKKNHLIICSVWFSSCEGFSIKIYKYKKQANLTASLGLVGRKPDGKRIGNFRILIKIHQSYLKGFDLYYNNKLK